MASDSADVAGISFSFFDYLHFGNSILSNFSVFFIIQIKKPLPVLRRVVRYEIMADRGFHNIRRYRVENVTVFLKKFLQFAKRGLTQP
jgi:hypothetical protein